jgi:hypothetical protein
LIAASSQPDRHASFKGEFEGVREKVQHDSLPHLAIDIHRLRQRRAIDIEL